MLEANVFRLPGNMYLVKTGTGAMYTSSAPALRDTSHINGKRVYDDNEIIEKKLSDIYLHFKKKK